MHKILLVDDMRSFLDLEATFLQRAECKVLKAGTGLDAVRIARHEKPDLVVLDLEMPEMNGLQACRILKSDPATQRIPVVVLTSMQMEEEAKRAGADHFLRKPIDEAAFLDEIRRFLPVKERAEPRASIDVPISFWRDGEPGLGRLRNLSRIGFLVVSEAVPPVGARIEVSFALPNDFSGRKIIAAAMVVRRHEAERGFACRFFQLSSAGRSAVDEFLERVAARQTV